jgi:hypothetical protein
MEERACHVSCKRCGYFEDCSDGMLPAVAGPAEMTKALNSYPIDTPPLFLIRKPDQQR